MKNQPYKYMKRIKVFNTQYLQGWIYGEEAEWIRNGKKNFPLSRLDGFPGIKKTLQKIASARF